MVEHQFCCGAIKASLQTYPYPYARSKQQPGLAWSGSSSLHPVNGSWESWMNENHGWIVAKTGLRRVKCQTSWQSADTHKRTKWSVERFFPQFQLALLFLSLFLFHSVACLCVNLSFLLEIVVKLQSATLPLTVYNTCHKTGIHQSTPTSGAS